jgi:hypothetical protein
MLLLSQGSLNKMKGSRLELYSLSALLDWLHRNYFGCLSLCGLGIEASFTGDLFASGCLTKWLLWSWIRLRSYMAGDQMPKSLKYSPVHRSCSTLSLWIWLCAGSLTRNSLTSFSSPGHTISCKMDALYFFAFFRSPGILPFSMDFHRTVSFSLSGLYLFKAPWNINCSGPKYSSVSLQDLTHWAQIACQTLLAGQTEYSLMVLLKQNLVTVSGASVNLLDSSLLLGTHIQYLILSLFLLGAWLYRMIVKTIYMQGRYLRFKYLNFIVNRINGIENTRHG